LPESLPYRRTVLLQLQGELTDLDHKIALAKRDQDRLSKTDDNQALQIKRLGIRLDTAKRQLASTNEERDSIKSLVTKGVVAKNRLLDLDRTIASLQADVQTSETDIAAAKLKTQSEDPSQFDSQRADLVQRIAELNDSIVKTPAVEAALDSLTRDRDSLQIEYRDATAKVAAAATGEDLEQNRQSERFEVIEQATPPTEPRKPNRPQIMLAGGLASIAAGVGVVVLKELLDKSVRTPSDLERRLQLRAISTIPYVVTAAERRRRRWRAVALAFLTLALLAAGLFLVDRFYLPLDALLVKLLAKAALL